MPVHGPTPVEIDAVTWFSRAARDQVRFVRYVEADRAFLQLIGDSADAVQAFVTAYEKS